MSRLIGRVSLWSSDLVSKIGHLLGSKKESIAREQDIKSNCNVSEIREGSIFEEQDIKSSCNDSESKEVCPTSIFGDRF